MGKKSQLDIAIEELRVQRANEMANHRILETQHKTRLEMIDAMVDTLKTRQRPRGPRVVQSDVKVG